MNLTAYGVDTAKNVFQWYTVEPATGEIVNRQIKRAKFLEYLANKPPVLIGMEACRGSHH